MSDPIRYSKPAVVPDDLRLLTGPTVGVVHLPVHLDWSGRASYDLDRPGRIVDLYRAVINEAASPADLHTYLNATTLKRLWSYIWLPVGIRRVWESRFPELAELSRLASGSTAEPLAAELHCGVARSPRAIYKQCAPRLGGDWWK